jgi:ABC-type branched-subunit amino acid transport system substrate-binding protein
MTQRSRAFRVGVAVLALSIIGAACGSDDASTEETTEETTADTTAPESGETPCGYSPSETTEGDLAGFVGTTPFGSGGVAPEFIERLCSIDPNLEDLSYAAEAYDAVMVIALAVAKAGTDGIEFASEIQGVTRDGEKCTDFVSCIAIIDAGGDLDYDGVSGPITLNGRGDPLEASYGFLEIGDNNRLDWSAAAFELVKGGDEQDVPAQPVVGSRKGDGVLKIGSILPQTGSLAFLGPPEFAGMKLAISDINAAGGVLGQDVIGIEGDSGDTSTDTASKTVDRQLAEGVDAIIGAASSAVTLSVIEKVTTAGVVLFSPANTSTNENLHLKDNGLYFRTAPPDIYQGDVLGRKVVSDGNQTIVILALNDAYGTGLGDEVEKAATTAGGQVVLKKIYDPAAASFDAEVDEIVALDPDAIVIIGFDETSKILRTMVQKGIGPRVKNVYGCDGNIGNALGAIYDAGN